MTPVLDQNPCGSCWAFASTGVLDSAALIAGYDLKENLSPQQLLDCIDESRLNKKNGAKNACDGGGRSDLASEYFSSTDKRYTISEYPIFNASKYYTRECAVDKTDKDPLLIKLRHSIFWYNQEYTMKNLIKNVGPISASVFGYTWGLATGGVIDYELCAAPVDMTDHEIMIVGWDDNFNYNRKKFRVWIVKNSWGTDVGDVFCYVYSIYMTFLHVCSFLFYTNRTDTTM